MADTAFRDWQIDQLMPASPGHKDAWQILWGLFTQHEQQRQDQLCRDLLQLPAASVNQYLLQYVYLAVSRPSGPLERAIVELCGRSFNLAVQVSWLLLALLQDQPGNQHIRQFRDACELAALVGGVPSHPHYVQLSRPQQQQQQPAVADPQQPWPAEEPTTISIQGSVAGPAVSAAAASGHCSAASTSDSRASTPFAAVVGDAAFCSTSPRSSPSAATAAVAAGSLLSASSMSSSHRFRDSLDFELMRHTSHQDLFAATAAAAAAAGSGGSAAAGSRQGSPTRAVQQLQQQQGRQPRPQQQQQQPVLSTPPKGLPPIRTTPTSGASSSTAAAASRRYHSSSPRLAHSPRKSRKPKPPLGWAVPGSAAAAYASFEDYFAVRKQQLVAELGEGEGVSDLIAASHAVEPQGVGWLVTHEVEPLSASLLLSMPPRSPRHAAGRDSYLATLDFVDALCQTSSSLTRFPPDNRRKVLRQCLSRISQEVEYAAEQGVAVRYPIGGCQSRVSRLLVNEAAILNSRDKAPFLLLMEVERDQDFVDEVQPEATSDVDPFTAAAAASSQQQPAAGSLEAVITLPGLDQQQQQQQQSLPQQQLLSPKNAAAAQQYLQQQQQPGRQRDVAALGRSPLSRGASPIPISPRGPPAAAAAAARSAPADLAAAQASPTAADAGSIGGASRLEASTAAAEDQTLCSSLNQQQQQQDHVLRPLSGQRSSLDHHHQQQQQQDHWSRRFSSLRSSLDQQQHQQPDQASWPFSSQRSSFDCLRVSTTAPAGRISSGGIPVEGGRDTDKQGCKTPRSAAAAVAAARPPTALEQQMQEAVARLRGDSGVDVIKLHLNVLEPRAPSAAAEHNYSPGKWSGNWSPTRRQQPQQQQVSTTRPNGRTNSPSWSCDNTRLTAERVESPITDGPWLFGELPADTSSNSLILDTAAAGSSSSRPTLQGYRPAGAAAGPVVVRIEVLGAPAVVQHVSTAPQAQPRRRGRRMPSVEAIDIIAGKLGSAVPPPTEIGPPLRLSISSSSSSSSSSSIGENDPSDRDLLNLTSPVSPVDNDDVILQQQQQQQLADASGTPDDSSSAGELDQAAAAVAGGGGGGGAGTAAPVSPTAAVADAGAWKPVDAAAADASTSSTSSSAVATAADSAVRQSDQQQQQPASAGWWGFLRNPLGRQQLQQPEAIATKQPDKASQQQQQQHDQDTQDQQLTAEAVVAARSRQASAVYGERWSNRTVRVRASATYSSRPGWDLAGLIVKSGDDCRQELLALQLIREFGAIWAAADLPLWLHPFEALVTSNNTALIELIPDATSIHSVKARSTAAAVDQAQGAQEAAAAAGKPAAAAAAGSSGVVSLSDHFFAKWRRGSAECVAAQQRFVESLAAYSLITYLLQVKDRHNGNIMLDDQGRLIHIDFGFMLSNAPGGNWVRFEAAPFKLTREMLEVMDTNTDGHPSELFDYFKVLCIQGFLVARRERQRIVGLVRIMAECSNPGSLHPPGSISSGCCRKRSRNRARKPLGTVSSSSSSSASSSPSKALSDLEDRWQGSPKAAAATASSAAAAVSSGVASVHGPAWPCFRAGPSKVVRAVEARFAAHLSDAACVQYVLRLIGDSIDAWSTRQYDFYQRVLNGIL